MDESINKAAVDAVNEFTRTQIRESKFWRRILPPLVIGNDELDRSIDTDVPVDAMSIYGKLERFVRRNNAFRNYVFELAGECEPGDIIGKTIYTVEGAAPPKWVAPVNESTLGHEYWRHYKHIEVGIEWVLEQILSCKFAEEEQET